MTDSEALAFARHHVAVWNSHDLEQILDLYTDDAELTSPLATGHTGGTVVKGRERLRQYFAAALNKYPRLHFELLNTLRCVNSVTLYFTSVSDRPVAEVLFLDANHKISKVFAHYSC
jgi:hypothetical protein